MGARLDLPLDRLPDPLEVPCLAGRPAFHARVRPPGSKSLTNRALLLAALAPGRSVLRGALADADDARRMIAALTALGAGVQERPGGEVVVTGVGGRWRPAALPTGGTAAGAEGAAVRLDLNNAGTATRFLAAAALLSPAPVTIDGNARMRQRPIAELTSALEALGVRASWLGEPGFPPVTLRPPAEPPRAATLELPTTLSSQFVSALLLVAPWLPGGLTLRLVGEVTSRSYVEMTLGLLERLGAGVRADESLSVIRVSGGRGLGAFEYDVEPDASGATYFWAAAAMTPGATCVVEGLGPGSLQGDAGFPALLERMGATLVRDASGLGVRGPASLAGIDADLSLMPDAAMTLAACACVARGPTTLRGLRTLRVKETDRVEAIRAELTKLGARVGVGIDADPDALRIEPPEPGVGVGVGVGGGSEAGPVELDTYDDHRMAMSLALVGLRRSGVFIRDPGCVRKTYPTFWADLGKLGAV